MAKRVARRVPGTIPDKLQPHNVEAEEAVIGALMDSPHSITRIASILDTGDFYIERHGWVFDAAKTLAERGEAVDFLTVTDEMERRGQLSEAGGSSWLAGMLERIYSSAHVETHARIIKRTAYLRGIINAAGEASRLAYEDPGGEIEEIADEIEKIFFSSTRRATARDPKPLPKVLDQFIDRLEYLREHQGEVIGLPTGLKDMDRLLGGLQRSDMVVMAGRPGMGKTSLALSIGLQAAKKHGKNIAVFSLEMSDEQLIQRLVSAETGITTQRLRTGNIKDEEWPTFLQAAKDLSKAIFFIDDTPSISTFELQAKARRLHAEYGLDLIIVDYLQLMRGGRRVENRQQEVSEISRSIKGLAKELNIPILALSQLSRKCEERQDKRPMLSDLRESGSIEQDADVVMFIYRDEIYNPDTEFPNIAEIIVGKHRQGPTGVFSVYFRKDVTQFINLEVRQQPLVY